MKPFTDKNLTTNLIQQIKSITSLFEKRKIEKYSRHWLVIILMIACLLASYTFLTHSDASTFTSKNGVWEIVSNLIDGQGYSACDKNYFPFCNAPNQQTAMREPLPVFLMTSMGMLYLDEEIGLLVQSLLYMGTVLAIYFLLERENKLAALLAAFFWTISIPVFTQVGNDTGHLTAAFFSTIGIYFFLRACRERQWMPFLYAGFFWGLASLSRTVLLGVSLGIGLVFLGLQIRTRSTKWISQAVVFLAVLCLTVSPWMVRNRLAFGSTVIGSTLTGYNVYRMNFFLGEEPFRPRYVGSSEGTEAIQKLTHNSTLTGTENEAQMNSFYMRSGKEIILQFPLRYIELSLYRFIILWFNTGVKEAYGRGLLIRDYIALIQQFFFLFAVVIGAIKRRMDYWPLALGIILGCGAYMAIDAQLRYLVDLMPGIAILSALALTSSSTEQSAG